LFAERRYMVGLSQPGVSQITDVPSSGLIVIVSSLTLDLRMPDPHLYFQALGGQCLRLVGIEEDLSFYEGQEKARTWQRLKRL
jgi:hypothetical protein